MGTIAEQMQKVIAEWEKPEPTEVSNNQPKGETEMKKETVNDLTATAKVLRFIEANPSVQKGRIQDYIERNHPEIPSGHLSSMLTQFTTRNVVTREEVFNKELNKTVYAYTLIPNDERKKILDAKRERRMTMIERARHAREMKRVKAEQKEKQQGISEALPTSTSQVKTYTDTQEFVNSLPIGKARGLYDELRKIFGG